MSQVSMKVSPRSSPARACAHWGAATGPPPPAAEALIAVFPRLHMLVSTLLLLGSERRLGLQAWPAPTALGGWGGGGAGLGTPSLWR